MAKIVDQKLTWTGYGFPPPMEHGTWESFCRLRIYAQDGNPVMVMVVSAIEDRETYPNGTGTSITDSAENLVRIVTKQFMINPHQFIWLEHYPQAAGKEGFARVAFEHNPGALDGMTFRHPRWTQISRDEAIRLAGDDELCISAAQYPQNAPQIAHSASAVYDSTHKAVLLNIATAEGELITVLLEEPRLLRDSLENALSEQRRARKNEQ